MNARDALKLSIDMGQTVAMGYVDDLTDADLLRRPTPGCNHINWQLGHCISSEQQMIEAVAPGAMPPLPAGFAEKYTKETATIDDPAKFSNKAELLATAKAVRAATLAALAKTQDADFDKPTGMAYAPSVGAVFELQGSHWLMHAGQWAVVRRQLGKPPLF
ncbi:MAG: DinB family protein [Pirellulales bacterium]|nr:DinB family protein [Pirellulales bacterium]